MLALNRPQVPVPKQFVCLVSKLKTSPMPFADISSNVYKNDDLIELIRILNLGSSGL